MPKMTPSKTPRFPTLPSFLRPSHLSPRSMTDRKLVVAFATLAVSALLLIILGGKGGTGGGALSSSPSRLPFPLSLLFRPAPPPPQRYVMNKTEVVMCKGLREQQLQEEDGPG
jgi:hypothetical protein